MSKHSELRVSWALRDPTKASTLSGAPGARACAALGAAAAACAAARLWPLEAAHPVMDTTSWDGFPADREDVANMSFVIPNSESINFLMT